MTQQQPNQLTPNLFFGTISAFQTAGAIKAAMEFDLFTKIDSGKTTAAALAESSAADERGMRILCDALLAIGFLQKQSSINTNTNAGSSTYSLTPESKMFLSQNSPAYLGAVCEFMCSEELMTSYLHVADIVRRGGTSLPAGGTVSHDNPVWVKFARAMMPMMMGQAQLAAQVAKCDKNSDLSVLDIAAGHGIFGIQFALQYPKAKITALDWNNVLAVAKENAQKFGVADRYALQSGDAFELDWGSSCYDIVLLPNFLHHFDRDANHKILAKAHAALKRGGKAITVEFVPNRDRTAGPGPLMFALTMLCTTERGDAYTLEEYQQMFKRAGFSSTEVGAENPQQTILISTY